MFLSFAPKGGLSISLNVRAMLDLLPGGEIRI
jgi:hypothetical protein